MKRSSGSNVSGPEPLPTCSARGQAEGGYGGALGAVMHVAGVGVVVVDESGAKDRAHALVWIVHELGQNVPNATVTGTWSGCTKGTQSGITGADGQVWIKDKRTLACLGSTTCRSVFTVTNVTHPQLVYDASENTVTSGSRGCHVG